MGVHGGIISVEDKKVGRDMDNTYAWRKKNLRRYVFDFNRANEKDVCDELDRQKNKRQYVIDLIRKDIKGR